MINFEKNNTKQTVTKNQRVLIRHMTVDECKWMCELFENCTGFDYSDENIMQCYIHTVPSEKIERKGVDTLSIYYKATRTTQKVFGGQLTKNWARKGKYLRGERSLYIICY